MRPSFCHGQCANAPEGELPHQRTFNMVCAGCVEKGEANGRLGKDLYAYGVRLNPDGLALGMAYYEPIDSMNMEAAMVADEMNLRENNDTQGSSAGERVRVAHALDRMRATLEAIQIALRDETAPIGYEATQALVSTAADLSAHAAAADAYLRAGRP